MISGLSYITLIVKDLNKTTTFLREILMQKKSILVAIRLFRFPKKNFF